MREANATQRTAACLPSFYILGAMKAGTGTLCAWLNHLHPDFSIRGTEVHYFGSLRPITHTAVGRQWCEETKIGLSKEMKRAHRNSASDCSPTTRLGYKHPLLLRLFNLPPVFAKCKEYGLFHASLPRPLLTAPAPKLIVLLREPADRARSQFGYVHPR